MPVRTGARTFPRMSHQTEQSIHTNDEPALLELLRKDRLTGKQTVLALKVVVGMITQLSKNHLTLQDQNRTIGQRVDRLYAEIFDRRGPDGQLVKGLSTSFKRVSEIQRTHEGKLSDVYKSNQCLRQLIAWIFAFFDENERLPNVDEMNAQYAAVMEELEVMGEAAKIGQQVFAHVAKSLFRCSGCVFWKPGSELALPAGVEATGMRCSQQQVAVSCPACGHLFPLPVDPNNITAKCGKCSTPLVREVTDPENEENVATLCRVYKIDQNQLRQRLIAEGILPAVVEALMPQE